MTSGVYKRTPEMLEKCRANLQKANAAQNHGETCTCAMCRGKRGEYAGENNPRYKHGRDIGWYKHHKDAREKKHLLPKNCERCGATDDLRIHHRDHDYSNNDLSNLEHICRSCHHKEHPRKKRLAEQRPCSYCGELNWYYQTRLNRNKNFFCNKECYLKWLKNTIE